MIKKIVLWVCILSIGAYIVIFSQTNVFGASLPSKYENMFSQNDILFYNPCTEKNSTCSITTSVSLPSETIAQLERENVKQKAEEQMDRYKYAEEQTGVLWQAIAALHYREGHMRSEASIYNGQNLTDDGSCYTNVDGQRICGDAKEDAKNAAEQLVSNAGYFSDHGDPSQPNATLEDYAAAFLTYYAGQIYKCNNKTYKDSVYVMNGFDSEHMNMSWDPDKDGTAHANPNYPNDCPSEIHYNDFSGVDDNVGALAVFVYLGGAERLNGGGDSCTGGGSSTTGNAIADKAMELSWPDGDPNGGSYLGNEAYNEAVKRRGGEFASGSECRINNIGMCYSCARFVSMVLLESNADPEFTNDTNARGGGPHMIAGHPGGLSYYLNNSPNWEEVDSYNGKGYDLLQPGDILINDEGYLDGNGAPFTHTFIYIGNGKVAEASNSDFAPYQHAWANDGYRAFRLKGDAASSVSLSSANNTSSGILTPTRDYNSIKNAKNANKQSTDFVKASGANAASWSDTSTEDMKYLLESYGDLAYQAGRAAGVPWVGILVQMRYEDSSCKCGKNNFWGLGCPKGTEAGGASLQGDNLGEGFVLYVEKGLLNGYHDQAIGIADPKKFLEELGPTWVNGNINGEGYSDIEGMKKSIDALQAFIETDEGQAIVKTFKGYSESNWNSSACGDSSSNISGGNGDVNKTAIALAWPSHEDDPPRDPFEDATPAYKKALIETGINKIGDTCSMHGNSCDAFVATVMRYSGADPDFACCGVSDGGRVSQHVKNSGKYEEIPNDLEHLQPGDIRLSSDHIELFVEVNGRPKIASASHCDRTGEIIDYYDSANFKAYRLKK